MRTVHSGIVDTLIGFRSHRVTPAVAALRQSDKAAHHPHGYMFKDVPEELDQDSEFDSVAETIALMDQYGIEVGLVSHSMDQTPEALRRYPGRFVGSLAIDGNRGMDQIREIVAMHGEGSIGAVTTFPAGVHPQIPINDKLWYPIYAKCIELDIPVFVAVGVPGPRVKMMPQWPGYLDEVCYDFPELKIVMRHGAEPWADLAVKLMLKWPNLHYSTSGFAPRHLPREVIDFANTRGREKFIYAGYFPFGLELERTFRELDELPLREEVWPAFMRDNARRVLNLDKD
ncbi:MAG: amidohydrolase family protein [Novosphingobium sp.]|nr:amidohydrolase family protein [Novosphingobium sp.]